MNILAQTHAHVVTRQGERLVLWNRMNRKNQASYSVYQHFGGKLYGRHDRRSALYSKEGLAVVARVVANQLLREESLPPCLLSEAEWMDQALGEYRANPVKGGDKPEEEPIGESERPWLV